MTKTKKLSFFIPLLVVAMVAMSEAKKNANIAVDQSSRPDWEVLKKGASVVVHDGANYGCR
jgi:hypothetical protein